jgi:type IV pilus assembly protein PilE
MERNYTEALRYDEDAGGNSIDDVDDVLDAPMFSDFKDEMTRYYNLSLVTTNTTYTIQAVPKAGQSGDKCGTLGLQSTGNRTAGHADCW